MPVKPVHTCGISYTVVTSTNASPHIEEQGCPTSADETEEWREKRIQQASKARAAMHFRAPETALKSCTQEIEKDG